MKLAHCGPQTHRAAPLRAAAPLARRASGMTARPRGSLVVRAESGGLGNFFKKDDSKEDAARKALQEAFAGKKDPFALDEERRKKQGGGGDGGDGGGGGGGGGGGFNFGDFFDGFRKWLRNTLKALAAAIAFFGAISLFYLWRPALDLATSLVRLVLRLDGNPRAQLAAGPVAQADLSKKEGLGNVEEAVISKWGAAEGAEGSEDEEEGSEEESDEE